MKRTALALVLLALSPSAFLIGADAEKTESGAAQTPAPEWSAEEVAPYEKSLDAALAAYNAKDGSAFATLFSAAARPPMNGHNFQALFMNIYDAEFGAIQSKTLLPLQTFIGKGTAQLVYDGSFEKRNHVRVSADFVMEGGVAKLVQIRMEKI